MTQVVNLRTTPYSKDSVYIGRLSKWGNPYIVGKHGTRDHVVALYKKYILNTELKFELEELRGKTLMCFCKPEKCHGDILVELLNQTTVEEFFKDQ